jgi:hypothetical protein
LQEQISSEKILQEQELERLAREKILEGELAAASVEQGLETATRSAELAGLEAEAKLRSIQEEETRRLLAFEEEKRNEAVAARKQIEMEATLKVSSTKNHLSGLAENAVSGLEGGMKNLESLLTGGMNTFQGDSPNSKFQNSPNLQNLSGPIKVLQSGVQALNSPLVSPGYGLKSTGKASTMMSPNKPSLLFGDNQDKGESEKKDNSKGKLKKGKLRVGLYKLSTERKIVKYVIVPQTYLRSPSFTFDDIFGALGIPSPNLIFSVTNSNDVIDWNMRLPSYKSHLTGMKHPEPDEDGNQEFNGSLRHYQGVIKENCRRLLRGTSIAW